MARRRRGRALSAPSSLADGVDNGFQTISSSRRRIAIVLSVSSFFHTPPCSPHPPRLARSLSLFPSFFLSSFLGARCWRPPSPLVALFARPSSTFSLAIASLAISIEFLIPNLDAVGCRGKEHRPTSQRFCRSHRSRGVHAKRANECPAMRQAQAGANPRPRPRPSAFVGEGRPQAELGQAGLASDRCPEPL